MKIVIIGYGGMGGYHANQLGEFAKAETGTLELAGIYDIDKARKQKDCACTVRRKRSGRTRKRRLF